MFKNPFSFNGRIRRLEYGITWVLAYIAFVLIDAVIRPGDGAEPYLISAFGLILIWFISAQGAKRCHDTGRSGWLQLIPLCLIWLAVAEGATGANRYGEDPKGGQTVHALPDIN